MQGLGDPDLFQLSEVVEKSSKSGIFSNERLLMIKDGFLHYYSTVPKDYKGHEPNLMQSLKEFPKSSIQIRTIKSTRLESQKSSSLIIQFNTKDMIDRQDIRKSVSSKKYNHPVKGDSKDIEQWKFTFINFKRCKQWYFYLEKLKAHFEKHHDKFDKFTELMANFDTELRNSLPRNSVNRSSNTTQSSPGPSSNPKSPLKPTNSSPNPRTGSPNSTQPAKTIFLPPYVEKPIASEIINQKYGNDNPNFFPIQETVEENDEDLNNASYKNKKKNESEESSSMRLSIDKILAEENQAPNQKNSPSKSNLYPSISLEKIKDIDSPTSKPQEKQVKPKQAGIEIEQIIQQTEKSASVQKTEENIKAPKSYKEFRQLKQKEEKQKQRQKSISKSQTKIKEEEIVKLTVQQKVKEAVKSDKKIKVEEVKPEIDMSKALEEAAKTIRQEERRKAQQQAQKLEESLKLKERLIKQMQDEIEHKKKIQIQLEEQLTEQTFKREQQERLRMILERQKKEEEEYKKLKESIGNEPSIEKVHEKETYVKEESIQTEFDRQFIEVLDQVGPDTERKSNKFEYDSESPYAPRTITNHMSIISRSQLPEQEDHFGIENYDYYWELSQLYMSGQSSQKVKKEVTLAQFVRKATKEATSLITSYIDENKPIKSIKIERFIFEIEIVCEEGSVVRTQGRQRLVYSNSQHQRLKRTFKIYNQINDSILNILKKKHNYPLRVPFCCLIQYKGYSALAQLQPAKQEVTKHNNLFKLLGPEFPSYNFRMTQFQAGKQTFNLLCLVTPYKSTKSDVNSIIKMPHKTLDFLEMNRRNNISIQSKKLFEEAQNIEKDSVDRMNVAKAITFCRQFKKVMKANTPFLSTLKELQFFEEFMRDHSRFIDEDSPDNPSITGILLHYCQKILGIRVKSRLEENELDYTVVPLVRKFSLNSLDITLFSLKIDKLCFEKKFDLVAMALNYLKELEEDEAEVILKEINLKICEQNFPEALHLLEQVHRLLTPHDPRKLVLLSLQAQCYEALGHVEEALSYLKLTLEETEYIYQDKTKLVEVYFMIAATLCRQNLQKQLVEVYKTILKESPSHKNRVVLEYSQFLLSQQADPHLLLDFIQEQSQHYFQSTEAQVLLGDVYYKCRNIAKAVTFYQTAFDNILTTRGNQEQVIKVFGRLLECMQHQHQKRSLHRQIVSYCQHHQTSSEFAQRINTVTSGIIFERLGKEDLEKWMGILQDRTEKTNTSIESVKILEWNELEKLIGRGSLGDNRALKQLNQSLDLLVFSQKYMTMINSELI